ncbi:uncharacterized protein LOC143913463 [Arctopsyche grandis]|uniref:uncharacterized protein LOC143913463 n=1 Tax=Arctopsyche grandis TaxID=121162 RepID=UPI00406D9160
MREILYLTIICFVPIFAKELPPYLKICNRDSPEINDCIKNSMNALAPKFHTGDLNYSIPNISQLNCDDLLKDVRIDSKRETFMNLTKLDLLRCYNYDVKNIKMHFNESDLKNTLINGIIGPFEVLGHYEILREYPFSKISSTGNVTGLLNFYINASIDFATYENDSKKYINATDVKVDLLYESGDVHFSKIYPLSNIIDKQVNVKINTKLSKYTKSINSDMQNFFNLKIKEHLNAFLAQYTYDQLLPEIRAEYLKLCNKNDPDLQRCIKKSVLFLKPYLSRGIPELKVPSIEPLMLREPLILNPSNGLRTVGLEINVKNISVYGCSDFDLRNLYVNFDKDTVNFDLKLKDLMINGLYNVDGRILLLPIKGNGKFVGNFSNSVGYVRMDSQIVKRDGHEYIQINAMKVKMEIGKGNLQLYNLFGGDRSLGAVINNVINENFDLLSKEFIPPLEKELSRLMLRLANNIVSQFTYKQLFPES